MFDHFDGGGGAAATDIDEHSMTNHIDDDVHDVINVIIIIFGRCDHDR